MGSAAVRHAQYNPPQTTACNITTAVSCEVVYPGVRSVVNIQVIL